MNRSSGSLSGIDFLLWGVRVDVLHNQWDVVRIHLRGEVVATILGRRRGDFSRAAEEVSDLLALEADALDDVLIEFDRSLNNVLLLRGRNWRIAEDVARSMLATVPRTVDHLGISLDTME